MTKLTVLRGTTNIFRLSILDPEGEYYYLAPGEVLRFGVKHHHTQTACLIQKELTADDLSGGAYPVKLTPEDTAELACGEYSCDVGLQSGEDYFSILPPMPFILEPNVTGKAVNHA